MMLFLIISMIIFNITAFFMHKNLNASIYYVSICFGIYWAALSDFFVVKYRLYYFFNPQLIEAKSLFVLWGLYPAATMMIINWFPYKKSKMKMLLYILACSLFSTFYEWLALINHILHYDHWKLWYSAVMYPFLFSALILNVLFNVRLRRNDSK